MSRETVFNGDAEVKVARVGRGGVVVTVVDDVLARPESVAALGYAGAYAEDRGNFYPGMRAPVPQGFSAAFRDWVTLILQRNGVLASDRVVCRDECFFSVVTTAGRDLLPIQCIPHYDSTDPGLFAAVLYLCDARFGGTSFYRHRKTGYEEITEGNRTNYQLALDNEMRVHGPPKREYVNGDGLLFEAIFSATLRFNRAVIYPGRVLHAGDIPRQFQPPQDKREWRLTVTALLYAGNGVG